MRSAGWCCGRESSVLDVEHRGWILAGPAVKKIAIAQSTACALRTCALAALRHYGIYEKVADRLVLVKTSPRRRSLLESGMTQVGVVALAHALAATMRVNAGTGDSGDSYPTLHQAAIILSRSSLERKLWISELSKTSPGQMCSADTASLCRRRLLMDLASLRANHQTALIVAGLPGRDRTQLLTGLHTRDGVGNF